MTSWLVCFMVCTFPRPRSTKETAQVQFDIVLCVLAGNLRTRTHCRRRGRGRRRWSSERMRVRFILRCCACSSVLKSVRTFTRSCGKWRMRSGWIARVESRAKHLSFRQYASRTKVPTIKITARVYETWCSCEGFHTVIYSTKLNVLRFFHV